MRTWLFRTLFGDEYVALRFARVEAERLRLERDKLQLRVNEIEAARRPARFRLDGGMTEEQIESQLQGTAQTPTVRAIMAKIDAKIVELCDRATNPPGERITPEMRAYESGGANAITELKQTLEDLVAAKAEKNEDPRLNTQLRHD